MKFTDRYVQSLKSREKEYCVREGHGFTIRVLPSGSKTFQFIYSLSGKRRRLKLGKYPSTTLADAREKYLAAAGLVAKGIDPLSPPQPPPPYPPEPEILTVAGLKSKYVEHIKTHLVALSAKHQDERLEKHLIPTWGSRPITGIRRRDAIELIESIASKKRGAARNILLAARAMFTFAVHREMVEYNPFSGVGVAVPQSSPNSRERVLSDNELKKTVLPYLAASGGNLIIKNSLLLILLTAQRPGEVAGMHANEIAENWWTIPWQRIKTESINHMTRAPQDHRVYLTPFARSLVLPSENYIFPKSRKGVGTISTNSLSHHITYFEPPFLGLARWTPHDLRRTAATKMSELGASDEIIDAILNHKKKGVIGTYNRNRYDKEKQKWLNKWSDRLEKMIYKG
ncbi:MAG TPA: integrase arm-type DNA-binding domain-containing protein [Geobacteraceae bacterium]|nr:integrase arm-type DNA-binding domain-containing protein [Geobacteraceae bacterium]